MSAKRHLMIGGGYYACCARGGSYAPTMQDVTCKNCLRTEAFRLMPSPMPVYVSPQIKLPVRDRQYGALADDVAGPQPDWTYTE